jgi:NAD(P)-dependent dehydrogenase (short-subunit alcohol dehydrogenase family)
MKQVTRPAVVVTGASTGIGLAICQVLIGKGWHAFGSVRKIEDAERLSRELGEHFTPLVFDVREEAEVRKAAEHVRHALGGNTLRGIVNNAGVAVAGPQLHLPAEQLRYQMEVNLIGPYIATQAFAPLLGADKSLTGPAGRIVQMSSVAGKICFPFMGPYNASKHALEGLSGALRRELMIYGIDVIIIGPGEVKTPIWDKGRQQDMAPYAKTDFATPLRKLAERFFALADSGLPPEAIGEVVHTALTSASPKTRYAVVPDKLKNWTIPRLLPDRMLDNALGKMLGLLPSIRK